MHKYKAKKTTIDGITFDSKGEANRYAFLKLMQNAKIISNLELQPTFDIIHNTVKICKVKLDFQYIVDGKTIYEDYKGVDLPMSKLKRKLIKAFHDVDVKLVRTPKADIK